MWCMCACVSECVHGVVVSLCVCVYVSSFEDGVWCGVWCLRVVGGLCVWWCVVVCGGVWWCVVVCVRVRGREVCVCVRLPLVLCRHSLLSSEPSS